MTMRRVLALVALGAASAGAQSRPDTLVVRNHHALPYHGALELPVRAADGDYTGPDGSATVRGGMARLTVDLAPGAEVRLVRGGRVALTAGPFGALPAAGALDLAWRGRALGAVSLALVVRAGTTATTEDAVRDAAPLPLTWRTAIGGALQADTTVDGFAVHVTAVPYGAGSLDVRTRLVRVAPAAGPAYVALVRRVTTPGSAGAPGARLRFNGRTFDGARSPDTWDRDFWYVHGVDWTTWRAGSMALASINGFTPTPTVQRKDSTWGEGSHFWVWERTRTRGDSTYLVSEIAGPNADQAKSSYMPVTPYAPVAQGDSLELRWRLAVAEAPNGGAPDAASDSAWAESQLRVFAGYRIAHGSTIDLGVPAVRFGTSYFPYSTMPENFDYVRTPGLDREVWWAFSPAMWAKWRAFVPRMRTDLHIIRAMGFDFVRLHHLELLQGMPKPEALAFLDFYFREVHALGLHVLIDSEGPEAWIREIAGRYRADIARVEVENEVLLYGIKPNDVPRLAAEARAAKAAAPDADVFLTSAGNNGVFERLRAVGVPFDRVGLHAYKHGPQLMETYASHVLGTADYAASLGKVVTLGEFNWKSFGRISDERRAPLVRALYETVLAPRAIPELFEFHFAETQSINTVLARDGTRHYEPLRLDRRPKPEARELMQVIREQVAADAPVRALPVTVDEVRLTAGRATARFTVTNATGRAQTVRLSAVAFDGLATTLGGAARVTLAPGASHAGTVTLGLAAGAKPGAYHHFVRAEYAGGAS
ncbi:MAG: hypothetical protein JO180_01165, partial [Gemmatirosa sp.]|nr:hypothetical protein [Gemmatirosa sp.]